MVWDFIVIRNNFHLPCFFVLCFVFVFVFSRFSRKKKENPKEIPAWSQRQPPEEDAIIEMIEVLYNSAILERNSVLENLESRL